MDKASKDVAKVREEAKIPVAARAQDGSGYSMYTPQEKKRNWWGGAKK